MAAHEKKKSGNKVFVVGLDGGTWDNLMPLMKKGELPFLAGLVGKGSWGALKSTVPCITPPAWGSFLTGASPALHGLLDFTDRMDTDVPNFVTLKNITLPKLWHVLTHFGRRSLFLNVPFTYPPDSIDGIFVPGPPVPPSDFTTFPPQFADEIIRKIPGYSPDLNHERKDDILDEIYRVTENRRLLVKWLMEKEPWDFFMVTFIATDRLHHKLWTSEQVVAAYYRKLDKILNEIYEGLDGETYFLLISDHGFTTGKSQFRINQWLAQNGFLKAVFGPPHDDDARRLNPHARRRQKRGKARGLRRLMRLLPGCKDYRWEIDLTRTKAFASLGFFPGVYVNLKRRYEEGVVSPEDYENVRDELMDSLSSVRAHSGERVFNRVARREDAFHGPHVERMPDIIVEPSSHSVMLQSGLGFRRLFTERRRAKGVHAPNGLFLAEGPGIRTGQKTSGIRIQDVVPLILFLMGLPQLSCMDGALPKKVLEPQHFDDRKILTLPAEEVGDTQEEHQFTEEEQAAIRKNLEALGYL